MIGVRPWFELARAFGRVAAPEMNRWMRRVPARQACWHGGGGLDSYGCRVAKWRDTRRFGPGPYVLGFRRLKWDDGFPFSVPAVATIERLELGQSVTLLAGDNGSGKSTILEAIAAAIGFAEHGGELSRLGDLPAVPRNVLNDVGVPLLAPVLSATKPRNGYFLRAESFFNIAEFIDSGDRFAPDLSLYGDVPLHAQSHGESFLALAANRFGADGVYLLDEPEAALSVTGALALLAVVTRAARSGAQFVIATHSPILLAAPDARIYELDEEGINITDYNDLQAVRLMRGFLDAPDRYLREITSDSEAAGG
jgi:predicted ATPase